MFFVPPEVVLDSEIGVWKGNLDILPVVLKILPGRDCHRAAGVVTRSELVMAGLQDLAQEPDAYWPLGEQNEHDLCVRIHSGRFLDTPRIDSVILGRHCVEILVAYWEKVRRLQLVRQEDQLTEPHDSQI